MIVRRAGLILAVIIALAGVPAALDISPDPRTGEIGVLPVVVAALTCAILAITAGFFVPAWRGSRAAGLTVATAQLAGILTALPAFFAPAGLVPPGGVLAASLGTLAIITVFAMIAFDVSTLVLNAVAVIVTIAVYASALAVASWWAPVEASRLVQTLTAVGLAVAYQPLVVVLRRTMGRALYGGRIEPAATALRITRVGARDADPVAAAVAETATALRFPRIELRRGSAVIAVGESSHRGSEHEVEVPIDGDVHLRVTLRAGERTLHRDDRAALGLLAPPLGLLVRESSLLADVRAARATIADVREREQLALHRDLHDGLGPLLTGAVMRADAARNLLDVDMPGARNQLDATRGDLRVAVAELRRVVYGLWPLELEQRGLCDAIAARAARAGVECSLPTDELTLPPAVELAVFRIASEALTNAEKHATDRGGRVSLVVADDAVVLEASNNASDDPAAEGMGLSSMRARAEELGGTVDARIAGGRWRLRARIPLVARPSTR